MQDTESVANQEISELICQQLNRSNESFDCFSGAYIASSAVLRHIKVSRLKDDFVPADGVHAALAGAAVQAARRSSLAVTSIEVPFLDYESFTGVNGDISKMFSSVDSSAEQARRNRMRDEWPVVFKRFLTDPTVLW
jgi:hypothetical protein